MSIDVKTLSEKTLEQKIEKAKAEREKLDAALKRYEEEVKRREKEVPLGVPQEGLFLVDANSNADERYGLFSLAYVNYNCFSSKESAEKHSEMLLTWRKALVDSAKGEPIDIEVLKPFLKKGWVAMDSNGDWYWYERHPSRKISGWSAEIITGVYRHLGAFNIKPTEDWKNSLQECGL